MSNLYFDEQDFFTNHPFADADVTEYPCVGPSNYALDWLTDPPQVTPDITRTESILGLHKICGSELVWGADQVPRRLNQTDVQNFNRSFPHAEQELSPGALCSGRPALHLVPLSPRKRVDSSLPQPQSIIPPLHHTSYPLGPDSTRQADHFECQWIDGVGPRGAVVEGTGSALMPQLDVVHAHHIGDERDYQEKVVSPGCGSRFARNESLPEHQRTRRAKGEAVTATGEYASFGIRDKDVQMALTTNSPKGYNQDWSPLDMIAFNSHLIDETEVICQWVDHGTSCNDPVKGKDLKVHLHFRHGVISDSQLCTPCLWHGCTSRSMKKLSLRRHIEEQHTPVKWACPTCDKTFTRKGSLMDHFERPCPGRV